MNPLTLRRWHGYVGMVAAPTVLFFALTGAVQLFNWHEAHGSYHPPVLLERLSSLHKDQVLKRHDEGEKSEAGGAPAAGEADGSAPREEESTPLPVLALKLFFFLIAIGVTVSTCFGVWMGLTQTPRKGVSIILLVSGALLPIVLIVL